MNVYTVKLQYSATVGLQFVAVDQGSDQLK